MKSWKLCAALCALNRSTELFRELASGVIHHSFTLLTFKRPI